MNGAFEIVIVVVLVAYIMIRRMVGQPAQGKRMLLLPGILSAIGLFQSFPAFTTPLAVIFMALTVALSVVIGLVRGTTIKVYELNGIVHMRYTVMTLVLWAVSFASKFALGWLLGQIDAGAEHSISSGIMLTFGASMLAEGVIVLFKALRTDGQIVWAKGKDGAPHQMSPFMDNMKQQYGQSRGNNYGNANRGR